MRNPVKISILNNDVQKSNYIQHKGVIEITNKCNTVNI